MKSAPLACVAIAFALPTLTLATPTYSISPLPTSYGNPSAIPLSITNSGLILGVGSLGSGVVWQGTELVFQDSPDTRSSGLSGEINRLGQSFAVRPDGPDGLFRTYRWSAGVTTPLEIPEATHDFIGVAINDRSTIAGYQTDPALFTRAGFWNNTTWSYLPTPTGQASTVTSINDAGQISGVISELTYSPDGRLDTFDRAAVWQPDGALGILTSPNTATPGTTQAAHISNNGMVVGSAYFGPDDPNQADARGFLRWRSLDAEPERIQLPADFTYGGLGNINVLGQTVATGFDADFEPTSYLFDLDGSYRIADLVTNLEGWHLDYVTDINDAGEIVGWGRLDGQWTGFLLTPTTPIPDPTPNTLLAPTTTLILLRRRR